MKRNKLFAGVATLLTLVSIVFASFQQVQAQSTSLWYLSGSDIRPNVSSWGLKLTNVTGSTQCLHADTNGVVSGTGSDCGSGSGGSSFAYPFPSNATSTLLDFSGGLQVGSLSGFVGANNGTLYSFATSTVFGGATTPGYVWSYQNGAWGAYATSSSASMVYPGAGIAVSTGSAWGTSLTDNSTNWNTAYTDRITGANYPLSISSNVLSVVATSSATTPLTFTASTNAYGIQVANTSQSGYLTSTDWNTFNGKQAALTGTTGQFPYFSGTNTVTATSTLQLASNGTFSVHPSLSYQGITVQGPYPAFYTDGTETNGVNYSMMESSGSFYFKNNTGDTGTWNLRNSTNVNLLSVDMSASSTAIDTNSLGYVGIDKTTPAYPLDVNGVINIATNASIEQGGLNLLTASTTQGTVLVGDAGINLIPGSTNYQDVAIGYDALFTATSSANNTAIGYDTLYHDQSGNQTWHGTGNLALGAYAGTNVTTGFSNALIGFNAGHNITTGAANVCIGYSVCLGNTTGGQNTAIGGLSNNNGTLNFNQTGYDNVAIGAGALNGTTSASENNSVGVGVQAGFNNYANDGTFVGYESAYNNTTGTANTAIGYYSLYDNVAGASNSVIGYTALQNATTSNNTVAIGAYAGEGSGGAYTSTNNIFIGTSAGASIAGGGSNTILGYEAANGITTGGQNVILGSANSTASDNQVTTGSNNISIGSNIALPSATANYQLDIGNEIYGTNLNGSGTTQSNGFIGIGTSTPGSLLSIGNTGGINFTLATSTFNSTGGVNLSSGCYAIGGNCVGTNASTITSGTLSVANGGTGSTTLSGILTGNGTSAVTSATISSPLSFSGNTLSISQANTSTNGYLSSTDWNTFNGKQAALTGTTGQFPYFSGTNTVTATSSLFLAANGDVGIGTTSPQTELSVQGSGITGSDQYGTNLLSFLTASTTGPIFAVEATTTGNPTLFSIDQYGHVAGGSLSTPVLSACGTSPTLTTGGNDTYGQITPGSTAAGCTVTFANAYSAAPSCVVEEETLSLVNALSYTTSATALTITQTALTSKLDYICHGQ